MKCQVILSLLTIGVASAARSDAPAVLLAPVETICSLDHAICATIDRQRQTTTVRTGRTTLWTMASAPPAAVVANGGVFLAEQFRPGGLLEVSDGPDTVVLVIRNRGAIVRRIRLADVVTRPDSLPRSVSHRRWSRVDYLASDAYIIDTEEGKRVRVALSDGTITTRDLSGGTSANWFCRYAQPTTVGPCASRNSEHRNNSQQKRMKDS